jgi:hypothetical protein
MDGGAQLIVSTSNVGAEFQKKIHNDLVASYDGQLQRRMSVGIFDVEQ